MLVVLFDDRNRYGINTFLENCDTRSRAPTRAATG